MLIWPEPNRVLEAGPEGPARDAQRATRASVDVIKDYHRLEQGAAEQLMKRLDTLQMALRQRLTQQITDFRRFNLLQLLADVDRMIADTKAAIASEQERNFQQAGKMGEDAATKPVEALRVRANAVPGVDAQIVSAAFGNAVDLLTVPMQQFNTEVKAALRRVALAGDGKMEEIQRLQRSIAGAGFDSAQYKAERIMRTELGRVFNQANFAKLLGLSAQFPFLKKGWRATPGNRTRQGHAEAGRTYGRGKGIPIAQRFTINVYDERDKKAPKLIGVAQLRFPIDPDTTPAGRVAAGATIMCRCNAFVDVDVAAYAAHTSKTLGQLHLGAPAPAAPAAAPRVPKPRKPRLPKVPAMGQGVTPAQLPAPVAASPKVGPAGPKVSAAVQATLQAAAKVEAALAEIDKVHGDGVLPRIPAHGSPSRGAEAEYAFKVGGRPVHLAFGRKMMANAPYMGTFHEVGHFLDHAGLGGGGGAHATDGLGTPAARGPMKDLFDALRSTKTSQALRDYRNVIGIATDGLRPGMTQVDGTGLPRPEPRLLALVKYLNGADETFARAYAQYITVKSGNAAALRELRNLQAHSASFTNRTVDTANGYGYKGFSDQAGAAPVTKNSWYTPWVWQDDEFKAVEEAFDRLFAAMGWRK